MSIDPEELQFCGLALRIAESEFSGSFNEDRDRRLVRSLYQEYEQSDTSQKPSTWLKERLASIFLWKTEPPRWIQSSPKWAFLDGEPMVFIDQFEVGSGSVAEKHLDCEAVLYVFGKRLQTDDGWEMRYQVREQLKNLP